MALRNILLLLLFILIYSCSYGQSVQENLGLIQLKLDQKKYQDAEVICDKLIANFPEEIEYIVQRAYVKDARSDRRGAINDLRLAVSLKPFADSLLNTLAVFYQATGMFDSSIHYFQKALKYTNDEDIRVGIISNMGGTYIYQKEIDKAINLYTRFLRANPENKNMLINLASAYQENKETDRAIRTLQKVIKLDPSIFEVYNNIGLFYTDAGKFDSAIFYFDQGLQQPLAEERKAYTYSNKGHCLHKLKKYDAAIEHYNKSISLDPKNPWVYKNKAETYFALKMKKEACEYLQESKRRGFEKFYGQEVNELINQHCSD